MPAKGKQGIDRRRLFKLSGAAAVTAGLLGHTTNKASAHYLKPEGDDYDFEEYESIVNRRDASVRMLFQFPNIHNAIIWGNARNAINGFQYSYGLPAESIQLVVQAYASANAATYDDLIWEKYQLGERLDVTDPETDEPALRNIWYTSNIDEEELEEIPEDPDDAYYADTSIEGLQRRGLLVLCWHQTIHGHARAAATNGWGPDEDQTAEEILEEIQDHIIPGALVIPSAVAEIVFLQDKGYRLVVNH